MVLDLAYGTRSIKYDLDVLTEVDLEATIDPFPREYWFDAPRSATSESQGRRALAT